MKSSTDKINIYLNKFREQKAAEILKLQVKVDAIAKQIENKTSEMFEANTVMDFEKAYIIKKELESLEEEKEFYLAGINRIKEKRIIDEGNYNAMNNEAMEEDSKAEADTIKKVYALLDEALAILTNQFEKRSALTRAIEQLAAEAGVIANPIGGSFYDYMLSNLDFVLNDGLRNMYEKGGSFYD